MPLFAGITLGDHTSSRPQWIRRIRGGLAPLRGGQVQLGADQGRRLALPVPNCPDVPLVTSRPHRARGRACRSNGDVDARASRECMEDPRVALVERDRVRIRPGRRHPGESANLHRRRCSRSLRRLDRIRCFRPVRGHQLRDMGRARGRGRSSGCAGAGSTGREGIADHRCDCQHGDQGSESEGDAFHLHPRDPCPLRMPGLRGCRPAPRRSEGTGRFHRDEAPAELGIDHGELGAHRAEIDGGLGSPELGELTLAV